MLIFLAIIVIFYLCVFYKTLEDNLSEYNIFTNILLSLLWAFFAILFLPILIIIKSILWINNIKEYDLFFNLYRGFKALNKNYKIKIEDIYKGFTEEEITELYRLNKKYGHQNNKNGWRKISDEEMEDILKWQNRRK